MNQSIPTCVTTQSITSPRNGLKITALYRMGKLARPSPASLSFPRPISITLVTATMKPYLHARSKAAERGRIKFKPRSRSTPHTHHIESYHIISYHIISSHPTHLAEHDPSTSSISRVCRISSRRRPKWHGSKRRLIVSSMWKNMAQGRCVVRSARWGKIIVKTVKRRERKQKAEGVEWPISQGIQSMFIHDCVGRQPRAKRTLLNQAIGHVDGWCLV